MTDIDDTNIKRDHSQLFPPGRQKYYLLLPLVLYFALSLFYLVIVPTGESPDEGGHVQCIEQVSALNRLPIVDPKPEGISWSRTVALSGKLCYHMPLYYLSVGYLQRGIAAVTGTALHYEFPPTSPNGPSPAMFVHPPLEKIWTIEEPLTMSGSRVLSILLWGMMMAAVYGITWLLWPESFRARLIAVTLLVGWPQFLFMSRAINNDALAVPLVAITLALLLKVGSPQRLIWATIVATLAILSKFTVAFGLIVVAAAWLMETISFPQKRTAYLRVGLVMIVIICALAGLLYFQPVLNEHINAVTDATSSRNPESGQLDYWLRVLALTMESGYVRFGMMNVIAPHWQSWAWWSFIIFGLIIGVILYGRHIKVEKEVRIQTAILVFWTVGVIALYFRININRFQPQFRYLFPLLPVITAFVGIGYSWLTNKIERDYWVVFPLALVLFGLNVWILRMVVLPGYWPALY
jgi:hypothetical protein